MSHTGRMATGCVLPASAAMLLSMGLLVLLQATLSWGLADSASASTSSFRGISSVTGGPMDRGIETIMPVNLHRTVATPLGNVQGIACEGYKEVTAYLGIPFAEPALGALRFRKPLPYSRPYPAPALQANARKAPCGFICLSGNDIPSATEFSSEDCLYMNIWTPSKEFLNASGPVPVRAFIHGGLINQCSASDPKLDGCAVVAKSGQIQVNIQYRKGPFGYLAHESTWAESNTTGNWALLDQQLALQWIQDNIGHFGGDPSRVMLFGNSAGAQAVEVHLVAPGSGGLFHSAVAQSPPCVNHLATVEQGYEFTRRYLPTVGCGGLATPEEELECMRQVPWGRHMASMSTALLEFGSHSCAFRQKLPIWDYTVDGVVIPRDVHFALATGNFHKVPLLTGTNVDEQMLTLSMAGMLDINVTQEMVVDELRELHPGVDPAPILKMYPEGLFASDPTPALTRLSQMYTDFDFACPVHHRLLLRSLHRDAPTYVYRWGATPSCPPEWIPLRACHTAELASVFGLMPSFHEPSGWCTFSPEEVELSNTMITAWSAMAAEGAPKWANGTTWVPWDATLQRATFLDKNFTTTVSLEEIQPRCEVWRTQNDELKRRAN